ncbi:hypothetical protein F5Y06DRAFT_279826 [Hypoxylon sp. FL0890]|nr:hypothetical protein F5Y06DRAFT_279826 [Hypoxylon sp. FL0890]
MLQLHCNSSLPHIRCPPLTHLVRYGSPRLGTQMYPDLPLLYYSRCIGSDALRWLPFSIPFLRLVSYGSLIWLFLLWLCWLGNSTSPGCELEFIWSSTQGLGLGFLVMWHLGAAKSKELNIIMYWGAGSTVY